MAKTSSPKTILSSLGKLDDGSQQKKAVARGMLTTLLVAVLLFVMLRKAPNYDKIIERSADTLKTSTPQAGTPSVVSQTDEKILDLPYKPAPIESYIFENTKALGWDPLPPQTVETCKVWKDPSSTPYHKQLMALAQELVVYNQKLNAFALPAGVTDLRRQKLATGDSSVCDTVDLNLNAIFASSQQLTQTRAGFVEPLLPPMRHPDLCLMENVGVGNQHMDRLLTTEYLVHDWATMCRQLKPTARTVFIDMGASLKFHAGTGTPSPALALLEQYRKMGFVFDHIYGYEMRQETPKSVYEALPKQYRASFHWINVGVDSDPNHMHNPWNLLLDNYNEEDLVVVKLDIDTPSVESPLARQLFNDPRLLKLVDHFYFEHHVNQWELSGHWGRTSESVEASFQYFNGLRQKGVAAHFWV